MEPASRAALGVWCNRTDLSQRGIFSCCERVKARLWWGDTLMGIRGRMLFRSPFRNLVAISGNGMRDWRFTFGLVRLGLVEQPRWGARWGAVLWAGPVGVVGWLLTQPRVQRGFSARVWDAIGFSLVGFHSVAPCKGGFRLVG